MFNTTRDKNQLLEYKDFSIPLYMESGAGERKGKRSTNGGIFFVGFLSVFCFSFEIIALMNFFNESAKESGLMMKGFSYEIVNLRVLERRNEEKDSFSHNF